MKIIATKKDVETLKDVEQYVIQPKGIDFSKGPESIIENIGLINELQDHIEKRFTEMKKKKL